MSDKKIPKGTIDRSPCEEKMDCKTLVIDDVPYSTTFTKKFENHKKWEKANPNKLISFIPGTILDLKVSEGQSLNEGEPMLILEAMKMRNIVRAPHTGKIKLINVKEGEKIPKGHLILEFE